MKIDIEDIKNYSWLLWSSGLEHQMFLSDEKSIYYYSVMVVVNGAV